MNDIPLEELVSVVSNQTAIPFQLDIKELDDVGLGSDTPVCMPCPCGKAANSRDGLLASPARGDRGVKSDSSLLGHWL